MRTQKLTARTTTATLPRPWRRRTVKLSRAAGRSPSSAVAYSLPGHTASGLPVGWGIVAVDPSVIPLGTHMTVPGYGEAVAADTGSRDQGRDHRPLVPQHRAGAGLGTAVGHDHTRLDFRRCRCDGTWTHGSIPARTARRQGGKAEQGRRHTAPLAASAPGRRPRPLPQRAATLLEGQGVDVCGEAETGTEALNQIRETVPDVVVMDLNMPGIGGVEATRQITMIAPRRACSC